MGLKVGTKVASKQRDSQRSTNAAQKSRVSRNASPARRLQHSIGNSGINRLLRSRTIQAQLTVSQPDDEFEREADRVATDVIKMAAPQPFTALRPTPPAIHRVCKECEEELGNEKDSTVQRKPSTVGEPPVAPEPGDLQALNGSGRPLPAATRSFFEERMGHDFGGVRIHTGSQADQLARSINAKAFTHSQHVVFRSGEYEPDTSSGRHLLAHELTHTIQQGASSKTASAASVIQASHASAGPQVQRVCEVTPPPSDMKCQEATTSTGTGTNVMFTQDGETINAGDKATISAIAAAWHRGGEVDVIRIDGFASCDGTANHNWNLSCRRAQAVARELEGPSDGSPGIPNTHLEVLANGETEQFSRTNLPPNRRVVITSGGTPPPGPTCPLTITGDTDVDHYCAAYVPSDAASCPTFPAPNVTLSVAGAAAGASLRWSITRGASRASIVGRNDLATAVIHGDAQSGTQGDVTVQVTDGRCTATHFMTVRQPSSMARTIVNNNTPARVQAVITYTVQDQFGNPMGANICVDETVTVCADNTPGAFTFNDAPTIANGTVVDTLTAPTAPGMCIKLNQSITAGGCGPFVQQTILFRNSGITFTLGAGCAVGDPCP